MRSHCRIHLPVLAACAAAAVATAQAQQPTQAPVPDPATRERVDVSDAQLGLEVQARLYQELDVSNLSALVRYGVATLNGRVRTDEDRQRAETLAREVRGVDSVVNELNVADRVTVALAEQSQAIAEREGANIETEVTAQLRADPALGSRSIRVAADGNTNTVTLSGTVSTQEEKERAGRIAVGAFPAGRVSNQIEVQQRL